jgi:hypothetical protein
MPLDLFAPQPVSPQRQHSFSSFQANNPSAPPPGNWLDSELNQVYRTLQGLLDWTGNALNPDGSLKRPIPAASISSSNADSDIAFATAVAKDYAVLSRAWAEHLPDTIPPNILASNDITGEHWSSRWWAHHAGQIVQGILGRLELVDLSHVAMDDYAQGLDGIAGIEGGGDGIEEPDLDGFVHGRSADLGWVPVLPLAGGTLTGDLTVDGKLIVGNSQSISTNGIVLAGHLVAGVAGQNIGGFVGSWDEISGGYTGFYTDAAGQIVFGSADAGSGTVVGTRATLDGAGNFTAVGTVSGGAATITGLLQAGSASFGNISGNIANVNAVNCAGTVLGATVSASGTVSGATVLATSLGVGAGGADITGPIAAHGTVTVDGTLAAGALASGGNLAVAGVSDLTGKLVVRSGIELHGISPYADGTAAAAAGHAPGDIYFNTTVGALSVVF